MIRRTLIFLLLFNIVEVTFPQEVRFFTPDYIAIKKITTDKKSSAYFPLLMEKFNNADTSLSLMDLRNLYYGFLFTHKYTPYPKSEYTDSCNMLLKKDSLTQEEYRQLRKFETIILKDCPFNLRNLNVLAYCYYKLGDSVSSNKTVFQLRRIVDVILSTGDGRTEKTAFHVISVGHEYDILQILGFTFGGKQTLTTGDCDYLEVQENEYNIEGLYFDVKMILEKEGELFKK